LDELEFYGIEGKFKTLIKSYLTGSQQRVVLGNIIDSNNTSKWETIKCRVPQGSILGPLFFLFYINDLPKTLNKNKSMVLYADDTSSIITDTDKLNFELNFNQTFRYINLWFNVNLLTLNFQKTKSINYIYIYMCVCVCVSRHNSGTPGEISTKLGTYIAVCMCKNLMYVLYIFRREDGV
jgi:hypothetical protein